MAAAITFGLLAFSVVSCEEKNPQETPVELGTVRGVVIAEDNNPVADATVSVEKLSAVTAVDGSFEIKDVPVGKHTVTIAKEGFADVTTTTIFKDGVADLGEIMMYISAAVIQGKCVNVEGAPYAGVTVNLNGGAAAQTTAEDGTYKFQGLTLQDYTLLFQANGCVDIEKKVSADQFKVETNYVVELEDVTMGAKEILPGATASKLSLVDVWHYNEYRGGKNGDDYPHFDWSSDYMGTFTSWYGWWEEQNEGTTLQIRNSEAEGHWNNPADLENFDSYLAGRKMITADNCKLYIKVRTHGADENSPAKWGVMVVDLTAADPKAELIGGIRSYGSDRYTNPDEEFDLTPYIGKEVVIAVGIFRGETGDYWKQVCLRRLAFAAEAPSEWGYLPGTPVAGLDAGYKMTMEMLRSTMPVTEVTEFSGISSVPRADVDGPEMYREAYKVWRKENHFAAWWSCMPVQKDTEPFAGEGYVMKTRGSDAIVSLTNPQTYFYAKFAIAAGKNKLTLNARNFSSTNPTYFKMTAILEDGTVKDLEPKATAATYEFVEGAAKFMHESGSADTPEEYAKFEYDLSEFNGKNVVIALATFKGEANDDENKLSIHSITLK